MRNEELATRLTRHSTHDDVEASHRRSMLNRLAQAPDPFDKDHFEPGHFTASGYVVSPDDRDVLLIFHESLERWLQPGGHFDDDDPSALDAARRELEEEVGLAELPLHPSAPCLFDVDVHTIPARAPYPEHLHFDVRFLFRAKSREFRAGSDAVRAAWVPIAELSDRTDWASASRVAVKLKALIEPA